MIIMAIKCAPIIKLYSPYNYLAPVGGCEVLFSPGLSVCVSVCLCICVSDNYFDILLLGY